jgi:16S rRNA processing protein RimM
MRKEDCYFLGKITKTHGLKGEVIIWLDVDHPDLYAEMDSILLLIKDELVPYFIEQIQIRGKKSILKLEDVNSIEETAEVLNKDVYLPLAVLPTFEDTSRFYYHEIIGFQLKEEKNGEIYGKITHVYEGAGQDLIAFEKEGKEILIPISDDIVKTIDRTSEILLVNLPEGLIDIYLES